MINNMKDLRIKSVELALQLPDNDFTVNNNLTSNGLNGTFYGGGTYTSKKSIENLLIDADKILNYLNKQ